MHSNSSNPNNFVIQSQLFSDTASNVIRGMYLVLSIAGLLNNATALIVLYRENALQRPYTIILMNLFIADMISGLSLQPFIWINPSRTNTEGVMADTICAITVGFAFFVICMSVNSLSLSALTILRYFTIVRNYHGVFATSNKLAKFYCICTWVLGVLFMSLLASSAKYSQNERMCYRKWPKGINGPFFSILTTILSFVVPALLMVFCYSKLLIRIWKQSKTTCLNNGVAARAKKSVALLLGLLILSFFICWTPIFTIWFLGRAFNYFSNGKEGEYTRQRSVRICMLFTLLNSVLDPLIYALSSSEYRRGFIKLFRLIQSRFRCSAPTNRVETTSHGG